MLIRQRLYAALYALSDAEQELRRTLEEAGRNSGPDIVELFNRLQELQDQIKKLLKRKTTC